MNISKMLRRLRHDELGQDLIEYSLMVGLVAVAVGATFPTTLGPAISTIFSKLDAVITHAASMG